MIPLLDLKREYAAVRQEVEAMFASTLATMHLLKGENILLFEQEIADYLGVQHAVGVASGTDALITTVLGLGIGRGDEVIVHANAFAAALEAIHHAGATPVVVDVEPDAFGPDAASVRQALTPNTKAVIAVHMYGSPLDLAAVADICADHNLALVEDCSHAHGASRDGRKVGGLGVAGAFSCGVVKNLAAFGDAGFVATNDTSLHHRIRLLGTHGQERKNHHILYGFNSRLDELQAAVLRVKLKYLDARNQRRAEIARFYRDRFANIDLRVTHEKAGEVHVYHQFVVRTSQRDALASNLKAAGIETGIHYPVPLHRQPAFLRSYGESPAAPRAERLANEILSLPVFPDLSDSEVERVAHSVASFFQH